MNYNDSSIFLWVNKRVYTIINGLSIIKIDNETIEYF